MDDPPAVGARVEVTEPGHMTYLAEYVGAVLGPKDEDMAVVRPKGWERKLVIVHLHQLAPTDRW